MKRRYINIHSVLRSVFSIHTGFTDSEEERGAFATNMLLHDFQKQSLSYANCWYQSFMLAKEKAIIAATSNFDDIMRSKPSYIEFIK